MKLAPRAIDAYLSRPDAAHRAALCYGPDGGLARERSRQLITRFLGQNYDVMALVECSEASLTADPARLADELSAISMLAPKRVIWVQGATDKCTGILESAAPYFNADALVIVTADELTPRSSLRAWFEKAQNAAAIACYHDEVRDVLDVIRKRFADADVQASRDVVDYISQQLGNDRGVTHQELTKLITYAAESKQLSLEDAQMLVGYNREAEFDDAVNALADRNLATLDRTLQLLLAEATPPVAYLRAMQRYFNRLYAIRAKMTGGVRAEDVVSALRPPVFFRQAPILTRHAERWSTPQIAKALALLIEAEQACKTSDLPIVAASTRKLLQVTQIR